MKKIMYFLMIVIVLCSLYVIGENGDEANAEEKDISWFEAYPHEKQIEFFKDPKNVEECLECAKKFFSDLENLDVEENRESINKYFSKVDISENAEAFNKHMQNLIGNEEIEFNVVKGMKFSDDPAKIKFKYDDGDQEKTSELILTIGDEEQGKIPYGATKISYDSEDNEFVFEPRNMGVQGEQMVLEKDGSITFNTGGAVVDPKTGLVVSEIAPGTNMKIEELKTIVKGYAEGEFELGEFINFEGTLMISSEEISADNAEVVMGMKEIRGKFVAKLENEKLSSVELLDKSSSLTDLLHGRIKGVSQIEFNQDGSWKKLSAKDAETEFGEIFSEASDDRQHLFSGEFEVEFGGGNYLRTAKLLSKDGKYSDKKNDIKVKHDSAAANLYFDINVVGEKAAKLKKSVVPGESLVMIIDAGEIQGVATVGKVEVDTPHSNCKGLQDRTNSKIIVSKDDESIHIKSDQDGAVAEVTKKVKTGDLSAEQGFVSGTMRIKTTVVNKDGKPELEFDKQSLALLADIDIDPDKFLAIDKDIMVELGDRQAYFGVNHIFGIRYGNNIESRLTESEEKELKLLKKKLTELDSQEEKAIFHLEGREKFYKELKNRIRKLELKQGTSVNLLSAKKSQLFLGENMQDLMKAHAYFAKGDLSKGRKELISVASQHKGSRQASIASLELAAYYSRHGNTDIARQYLNDIIKHDPISTEGKQAKKTITKLDSLNYIGVALKNNEVGYQQWEQRLKKPYKDFSKDISIANAFAALNPGNIADFGVDVVQEQFSALDIVEYDKVVLSQGLNFASELIQKGIAPDIPTAIHLIKNNGMSFDIDTGETVNIFEREGITGINSELRIADPRTRETILYTQAVSESLENNPMMQVAIQTQGWNKELPSVEEIEAKKLQAAIKYRSQDNFQAAASVISKQLMASTDEKIAAQAKELYVSITGEGSGSKFKDAFLVGDEFAQYSIGSTAFAIANPAALAGYGLIAKGGGALLSSTTTGAKMVKTLALAKAKLGHAGGVVTKVLAEVGVEVIEEGAGYIHPSLELLVMALDGGPDADYLLEQGLEATSKLTVIDGETLNVLAADTTFNAGKLALKNMEVLEGGWKVMDPNGNSFFIAKNVDLNSPRFHDITEVKQGMEQMFKAADAQYKFEQAIAALDGKTIDEPMTLQALFNAEMSEPTTDDLKRLMTAKEIQTEFYLKGEQVDASLEQKVNDAVTEDAGVADALDDKIRQELKIGKDRFSEKAAVLLQGEYKADQAALISFENLDDDLSVLKGSDGSPVIVYQGKEINLNDPNIEFRSVKNGCPGYVIKSENGLETILFVTKKGEFSVVLQSDMEGFSTAKASEESVASMRQKIEHTLTQDTDRKSVIKEEHDLLKLRQEDNAAFDEAMFRVYRENAMKNSVHNREVLVQQQIQQVAARTGVKPEEIQALMQEFRGQSKAVVESLGYSHSTSFENLERILETGSLKPRDIPSPRDALKGSKGDVFTMLDPSYQYGDVEFFYLPRILDDGSVYLPGDLKNGVQKNIALQKGGTSFGKKIDGVMDAENAKEFLSENMVIDMVERKLQKGYSLEQIKKGSFTEQDMYRYYLETNPKSPKNQFLEQMNKRLSQGEKLEDILNDPKYRQYVESKPNKQKNPVEEQIKQRIKQGEKLEEILDTPESRYEYYASTLGESGAARANDYTAFGRIEGHHPFEQTDLSKGVIVASMERRDEVIELLKKTGQLGKVKVVLVEGDGWGRCIPGKSVPEHVSPETRMSVYAHLSGLEGGDVVDLGNNIVKLKPKPLGDFSLKPAPKAKPFLTGGDIMSIKEVKPGPEVGKYMNMVKSWQAKGLIHTREEAIKMLKAAS